MKTLLLAGGKSTRMGSPKHLLPFPNEEPVFLHIHQQIQTACPDVPQLHISIGGAAKASDFERIQDIPVYILHDDVSPEDCLDARDIGPAAGLLAAYRQDPFADWLIVACDYPLLSFRAILQLREQYEPPVTCFQNEEGFCEALLGIWSSEALKKLQDNVRLGNTGPSRVVSELRGKMLKPLDNTWLTNTNTKQDWESAMTLARGQYIS